MVMEELDIGPRPTTIHPKEEIVRIFEGVGSNGSRSRTSPSSSHHSGDNVR